MTIQTNTANISKTGIVVAYTDNSGAAVSQNIGFANKTLSVDSGFNVVAGDTSLAGALNVAGVSNLNAALNTVGASHLQNTLLVDGAATMGSTLGVNGVATMNAALNAVGASHLQNTLQVDGASNLGNSLTVASASALNGSLAVAGISNLNNALNVSGAANMNAALNVANAVTLNNTLDVYGATHFESSMLVDGTQVAGPVGTAYNGSVPLDNAHVTYTIYNSIGTGYLTVPQAADGAQLLSISFFGTGAINAGGISKAYFNFPVPGNDGQWFTATYNQMINLDMTFGGTYSYTLTGGQQLSCYISTLAGYRYFNMVRNGDSSLAFKITYQKAASTSGSAVTLGSTLTVAGASVVNNNATVNGTSALNGALTVSGASSLGGSLAVTGAASLNSTMLVSGSSHLSSTALVDGAATLGSSLAVAGAANLNNVLNVAGAANLNSTMLVDGAATVGGSLVVGGDSNLTGALNAVGASHIRSTLQVDQAATLGDALAVAGDANLGDVLNAVGASHLSNALQVDQAATLGSSIAVQGAANMANVLNVAGASALNSTLAVQGAATLNNTLAVTGASNVANSLTVTGVSNMNNVVAVAGPATFRNNMTINGNLTVLGNQTSINTNTLQVQDNAVLIADNNTADALQSAIQIQYQPSGSSAPKYAGMKRLPTSANNYGGEFVFFKDAASKVSETAANATTTQTFTLAWKSVGTNILPMTVSATSPASGIVAMPGGARTQSYTLPAGSYNYVTSSLENDSNDWCTVNIVNSNTNAVISTIVQGSNDPAWGNHGPFSGSFVLSAQTNITVTYSNDYYMYNTGVTMTLTGAIASVAPADIYAPVIADSFNCASDMNLKKNVINLDGALDKLDALSGVYHDWIDENQSQERQIGVIAQEVQAVYPELVAVGSNGYLSVNYPKLTAVLLQSVKELKAVVLEMIAEQM